MTKKQNDEEGCLGQRYNGMTKDLHSTIKQGRVEFTSGIALGCHPMSPMSPIPVWGLAGEWSDIKRESVPAQLENPGQFFVSAPAEGTYLLQINIRQKCLVKHFKLSVRMWPKQWKYNTFTSVHLAREINSFLDFKIENGIGVTCRDASASKNTYKLRIIIMCIGEGCRTLPDLNPSQCVSKISLNYYLWTQWCSWVPILVLGNWKYPASGILVLWARATLGPPQSLRGSGQIAL